MCYTREQIECLVKHYGMEVKRRLYALQKLCSSTNLEWPQPPAYLLCHTIPITKNLLKMQFRLKRGTSSLTASFQVLKCYQGDGSSFSSIGGLFVEDANDSNLCSMQVETLVKALAVRPAAIDSFIWYCEHVICWLDRVYDGLQRHLVHLRQQRESSKSHRRVLERLAEVESALIAQKLSGG